MPAMSARRRSVTGMTCLPSPEPMPTVRRLLLGLALASLAGAAPGAGQRAAQRRATGLAAAEQGFAVARDWEDRLRLLSSLGKDSTFDSFPAAAARDSLGAAAARFHQLLARVQTDHLGTEDRAALDILRLADTAGFTDIGDVERTGFSFECGGPPATAGLPPAEALLRLTDTTLACFTQAATLLSVDGEVLNRLAVLSRLATTDDPDTRRRLFAALQPIWRSVDGNADSTSPYRRLLAARRRAWGDSLSPLPGKGAAYGLASAELERWLVEALESWHRAMPDTLLEPWDWYYFTGAAGRRLTPSIPALGSIERVNRAWYASLGADLDALHVRLDLQARRGKYPIAYTDFGRHRRPAPDGSMLPAEPWIFASYLEGGFENLAELVHESGHAIHIAAIRGRPALADWPDNDTFIEALADLPAQEIYEARWQQAFLGDSAPTAANLRERYAGVVLDMAWALFELRVHADSTADPNLVWAGLTSRYLGIRPHPEWSWWAMRAQLVDAPGYLINYALGAFLVADLRARVRAVAGRGAWSDPATYALLSWRLYRFGRARPGAAVLTEFLGRRPRPDALLRELERLDR